MGGKNPAIIMPSAKLDDAAEGVMRSAFGMGGEKCSACSRVYVHKQIFREFLDALVEKTKAKKIGIPTDRDTFLGPLINEQALVKFQKAVALGKREGTVLYGGHRLIKGDFANGYFVEPAIITGAPKNSKLFEEEFFAPILAVAEVKSLDEALTLANAGGYGLTAGIFTENGQEQEEFFSRIEAGVAYCNRRGGATTGAWPGVQSFGGWKGSGSSGRNALGPYYIQQFMREQSQTIVIPELNGPTKAPQFDAFQRRGMDYETTVSAQGRW
jgi:1-pyrroline-5-carboxylate dehydrogenase